MDYHAFDKLSYGLYIVSSEAGGKAAGCIVNTLGQVTVSPVQVAVTINKENQTTRTILESGKFSATVLAESASMELIGRFGFQCSRMSGRRPTPSASGTVAASTEKSGGTVGVGGRKVKPESVGR